MRALSDSEIEQFIRDGFVRIDQAFPPELAEEGRAIIWRDIPCDPHDPSTWTRPIIRLPVYGGGPFRKAANTPILHTALDQLVGRERRIPRDGLGTWPVRFPHPDDPGDAGWHVDVSFPGDDCDPNGWRRCSSSVGPLRVRCALGCRRTIARRSVKLWRLGRKEGTRPGALPVIWRHCRRSGGVADRRQGRGPDVTKVQTGVGRHLIRKADVN